VWPGVLGVPSQALDLFADFRLGRLASGDAAYVTGVTIDVNGGGFRS
jgi:hypothetical protein